MDFLKGVVRLSRYKEVLAAVAVLSVLGLFLVVSNDLGQVDTGRFVLILLANFLATTFAFMINDVEDAEDDARDPKKAKRNPISAGMLTPVQGTIVSLAVAGIAQVIYFVLGGEVALAGAILIITGFLYSWKVVRFKGMPFVDMLSHAYFLASGILLTAFLTFSQYDSAIMPAFLAVYFISIAGDMFNEIRDYESDRKANLKNTVSVIGLKASIALRFICTAIGLVLAVVIGITNINALNLPAVVVGLVVVALLASYMVFIAKKSILDYDNVLFYNTLLGVIFAVLLLSTYT